jgi:hypothetical protein
MFKRQLFMLAAAGILAGAATASSASLSGAYRATIAGKPAALNGRWRLEFLPRGVYHIIRNGNVVVVGRTTNVGTRRLKFRDFSGSYACSAAEGNGTYRYSLVRKRLRFTAVTDNCRGRKLVLTTKPFLK